ncbi:MAG TPA: glycosyltransferase [Ktedonobacterales bacterium]
MRILFVVPYTPSQLRVRPYGFVRHLARQHGVHVLALSQGTLSRNALVDIGQLRREGIPVTVIQEPRYRPYLRTLVSTLVPRSEPMPLQVAYTASPALRAAISRELQAHWYDAVHVEHVRGIGALPAEPWAPVVWDAVDCVSLLYEQGAQHGATSLVRMVGQMEARRLRAFERRNIERFRQVLVTSERDRQELLKLAEAGPGADATLTPEKITVLPHGIDPRQFRRRDVEREPDTLIFAGKMDYHANVAGAMMLARQIMPLIWHERPNVRLIIAGSNPTRAVRQLARDKRITVTGYVRDLNALVSSACVSVSPLPYAVGIQNKVLEAMAAGTPVVASSSSAGGLQTVTDRDLLVADTPEEFAAATLRLLSDTEAWHSVARHGAAYIAAHHDWDTIIERLTLVYEHAREVRVAIARHARAWQTGQAQPSWASEHPAAFVAARPEYPGTPAS